MLPALASGLPFSLGLTVSQMINPAKVIGLLDVFGDWDPSLAFVMATAIPVTVAGYLVGRRRSPLCASVFTPPTQTNIDRRLTAGAVLFGGAAGGNGIRSLGPPRVDDAFESPIRLYGPSRSAGRTGSFCDRDQRFESRFLRQRVLLTSASPRTRRRTPRIGGGLSRGWTVRRHGQAPHR